MNKQLYPMLSVRRGASAVEFYKRAFGAEELFRVDDSETGEVGLNENIRVTKCNVS